MKKDFQKWHDKKAQVDDVGNRPFFHEREIGFCYLGANIGFEQDYFAFSFINNIKSVAILSQIRLIDARRLSRHIGVMSENEFAKLKEKLKVGINL